MKRKAYLCFALFLAAMPTLAIGAKADDARADFVNPPLEYVTRPLWFWNNTTVTETELVEQMHQARDKSGYGGFGILPFGKGFKPKFLSDEYFQIYGVAIPEADYVDVGELLAVELGRDYTFIHPEVLDEKCSLQDDTLVLNNKVNREQYRVMIVPGHKTIAWSNLKKIKQFYGNGGKVIATGTLPSKSAEFDHDADVRRTIAALFPNQKDNSPAGSKNAVGGTAVFLPQATADILRKALDAALAVYDVEFEPGKELRYIHKVVGGKNVFFFANLQKRPLTGRVRLRGQKQTLEVWNPHTGAISKLPHSCTKEAACDVTEITLKLSPTESVFVVCD